MRGRYPLSIPLLVMAMAFTLRAQTDVEYIIQYDDGNTVYYSGRPQPFDTCGVWFEPPTECQILAGQFQFNGGMGGEAEVWIWDIVDDFDPDNYFDSDEPNASPGPSPLGERLTDPITIDFNNSGVWQEIVFEDYGYPPEDLDVGTDPFYIGYVLLGTGAQPYYPSILGDAEDDRPYHSLAWLTDPAGSYPGVSGWWAYGIDWMLRARVDLYGDPLPVIEDLVDPPDTYTEGPYTITATITDMDSTGVPGSGQIVEARLIYSVDGGDEITVIMINTVGDTYEGSIPAVGVNQLINFRVEADDDIGNTSIAPGPAGYNFTYRQPSGATILLVNDSGGLEGEDVYRNALENGGFGYDYWYINPGEPDDMGYPGSDVISASIYSSIIWFIGVAFAGSLPDNDADLSVDPVANYMDDGGNFFLSSMDYLGAAFNPDVWTMFVAIPGTFMYEYLKVFDGWSDSHTNPMTGESMDTLYFGAYGDPISGDYTAGFYNYPDPNYNDYCNPIGFSGAETCFMTEIDDESAGIRYNEDYGMVFLSWALEACDDQSVAEGILQNVLEYFGEIGSPPFTVELVPFSYPIQIPASGGSFEFYAFATNNGSNPQAVDLWSEAVLPDGSIVGPLMGPANSTLDPGTTGWYRVQNVPGNAPPGNYDYYGYAGIYPDLIWASDEIEFEKLETGDGPWVGDWSNWGDPIGDEGIAANVDLPETFALYPAYPNPFNPITTLSYDLPENAKVSLKVYNLQGRLVATLVDGMRDAGTHEVTFDGSNLSSGIYIYRLTAGNYTASGKMVLVK